MTESTSVVRVLRSSQLRFGGSLLGGSLLGEQLSESETDCYEKR